MVFAERAATQKRGESDDHPQGRADHRRWPSASRWSRACPGPARRSPPACCADLDRVTATRLSFFLGIPALTAAGVLRGGHGGRRHRHRRRLGGRRSSAPWSASWSRYASIAWLLRFVARHSITRLRRGTGSPSALLLLVLLASGLVSAT